MTVSRRARLLAAIGAIAFIPAALTACSGGGQSVADACQVAQEKITDATSGLSSAMSDPEAAETMFADMTAALKEAGDEITNEEVKSAYDDFTASFDDTQSLLEEMAADPANADMDAITEATNSMTDSATKITEVCSG